jgi:hypothetical protein
MHPFESLFHVIFYDTKFHGDFFFMSQLISSEFKVFNEVSLTFDPIMRPPCLETGTVWVFYLLRQWGLHENS